MPGAAKDAKRSLVGQKTGPPKSPIGFLGRRKHNVAVSFSARKTISGVCADDAVAVNFSAVTFALIATLPNYFNLI